MEQITIKDDLPCVVRPLEMRDEETFTLADIVLNIIEKSEGLLK